jgi:hypothetical protein
VDEQKAVGPTLSQPFTAMAAAARPANEAGLTTNDFLQIIDKMSDFAKVISDRPRSAAPTTAQPSRHIHEGSGKTTSLLRSSESQEAAESAQSDHPPQVSAAKRTVLSGFGFLEKTYHLMSSTATLSATAEGSALLAACKNGIATLGKLIGLN